MDDSNTRASARRLQRRLQHLLPHPHTLTQLLEIGIWGALFSIVLFVIWTSRLLRPIADDYGIAVAASRGLMNSILGFWENWSGALTSTVSLTLFVGFPSAKLPWSVASAIPFLSSAVLVSVVGLWLILPMMPREHGWNRVRSRCCAFAVFLAAWWGYWWLPVHLSPGPSLDYAVALGATHWQSVLAGYVIPMAPLVWAPLVLESKPRIGQRPRAFAYFALGILAGFTSPVFAASALALALILAVVVAAWDKLAFHRYHLPFLTVIIGTVAGALGSHFSPGSQYRATLMSGPKDFSDFFSQVFVDAVPNGLGDWFSSVAGPGALVVLLTVTGTTYLLSPTEGAVTTARLLMTAGGLLVFSLISFLVNRISEIFVYEAFWHLTGPRAIAWLGLVTLAIALGSRLARFSGSSAMRLVVVLSTCICLYFLIGALDLMCRQIVDRSEPWEIGPAPVYDISDIEDPHGWILPTWLELKDLRDAPNRRTP